MPVSLTFDDGWLSQYENAVPILDRYAFKATFYIITKFLSVKNPNYMSNSEIKFLYNHGHEIGGHSVTHPNLSYTFPWKYREIRQCKLDLSDRGIIANSFSYPYGKHHKIIRKIVQQSGFSNARAAGHTNHKPTGNPFAIKSKTVKVDTTIVEISKWLESVQNDLLVIVFHQIDHSRLKYSCSPELLEQVCHQLNTYGIIPTPLSKSMEILGNNSKYEKRTC